MQQENIEQVLLEKAMSLLSLREHGDKELIAKLAQKVDAAPDELLAQVLEKCQAENWQSDERYVERYVLSAIEKGHGPFKIRQTLGQRTSRTDIVTQYLAIEDTEWSELARKVLVKKYGDSDNELTNKEQARRMRFLASRGFSQNQIWKAFK